MLNESTAILPVSVRTFPRYEFVGNTVVAKSGRREDHPLHKPQRAAMKSVGAATIAAVVIFGFGWLASYGSLSTPPGAADIMKENDVLSAKPIVMTHGVVRGASGVGWMVTELDNSYTPAVLSLIHGGNSPTSTACAGAFSDADWHPSHFGVLHLHTDHPGEDGTTAYGGYTASERAEACGVLEGYFTHGRILQTAKNLQCEVACDGSVPPAISEYFTAQDAWTDAMVAKARAVDGKLKSPGVKLQASNPAASRADTTKEEDDDDDEEGGESSDGNDIGAALWVAVGYQRRQLKGLQIGSALRAAEYARMSSGSSSDGNDNSSEDRAQSQDGVYEGVNLTMGATAWDLTLINNLGDLFDVKPAVLAGQFREDFSKVRREGL